MKTVLFIPDTHAPYVHPDALAFLGAVADAAAPTLVVHVGDEVDHHALSYHDSNPDLASAGHELDQAIAWLKKLAKLFPNMLLCDSNHGSLAARKALTHGMPAKLFRPLNDLYEVGPGWQWEFEHVLPLPCGAIDMVVRHSWASNMRTAIKNATGACPVQGHFHGVAGVELVQSHNRLLFAMSVGCLIDTASPAFAYGKGSAARPVLGCGLVVNGCPQFVPMFVDKRGRWNKKLPGILGASCRS